MFSLFRIWFLGFQVGDLLGALRLITGPISELGVSDSPQMKKFCPRIAGGSAHAQRSPVHDALPGHGQYGVLAEAVEFPEAPHAEYQ